MSYTGESLDNTRRLRRLQKPCAGGVRLYVMADAQGKEVAKVPGDEAEFIPLP